jgi:hypothetical protein
MTRVRTASLAACPYCRRDVPAVSDRIVTHGPPLGGPVTAACPGSGRPVLRVLAGGKPKEDGK